jgi:Tol biopolymer transport system component
VRRAGLPAALTVLVGLTWGPAAAAAAPAPALVSATPQGAAGNGLSGTFGLAYSADGDWAAFSSMATDLGPAVPDSTPQIYVRRLSTGTTTLASATEAGGPGDALSTRPAISGDGGRVAFLSSATNLDPRDDDQRTDAYVTTLATGEVRLISTSSSGEKADAATNGVTISDDDRTVAFITAATNLDAADTDAEPDVYVEDLATGTVRLASAGGDGTGGEYGAAGVSLSADGQRVAFSTDAALVAGDDNERADVYVKDLASGELVLASATASGTVGDAGSTDPELTADGSSVVFATFASNLDPVDGDAESDIYRNDLATSVLTLLSTTSTGEKGDASSSLPSVSGDGRFVSFATYATNLDPRAAEGRQLDVYVKDTATGEVVLASASADGTRADGTSLYSALSGSGSRVVFTTNSTNLSEADTNRLADVYVVEPIVAAPPPPPPPPPEPPPVCGHPGPQWHRVTHHRCRHGRRSGCRRCRHCGRRRAHRPALRS